MRVTLTPDELRFAAQTGVERRIQAISAGRRGAYNFDRDDYWRIDIEGACAEQAAAKAFGLDYSPVVGDLDHAGDIGPGLQVRSTKYESGHLLVHDRDADDHVFILVTGEAPSYRVAGWLYGREGKRPEYWHDYKGRHAYWIKQEMLRDWSLLTLPD